MIITEAGAAANQAAANKIAKYDELASTVSMLSFTQLPQKSEVPGITGLLSLSRKSADRPH